MCKEKLNELRSMNTPSKTRSTTDSPEDIVRDTSQANTTDTNAQAVPKENNNSKGK